MFVDLTVAVQVGVVVASLLFIRRMSEVTHIEAMTELAEEDPREIAQTRTRLPAGVEVYEVNGPFFFGAADKVKDVMREIAKPPAVLILRMRNVPAIDATGMHALEQMAKKCRAQGTRMILSEVRSQPLRALVRAHKVDVLGGRANLAPTLEAAIERAAKA